MRRQPGVEGRCEFTDGGVELTSRGVVARRRVGLVRWAGRVGEDRPGRAGDKHDVAGVKARELPGWHGAAADGANPLSHTMTGRYARILLNGAPLSEYGLHARPAAEIGVRVMFLSGDAAICTEARATNPAIVTVETKTGTGASVDTITPAAARKAIREGVARALEGDLAAHTLPREDGDVARALGFV